MSLPFLAPLTHTVPSCLTSLERNPELIASADLERARAEWQLLQPVLSSAEAFTRAFPGVSVQVVHGDAPAYNLIRTRTGLLFAGLARLCAAARAGATVRASQPGSSPMMR